MWRWSLTVLLCLTAACAAIGLRPATAPPLDQEGELFVELQAFPAEMSRLSLELDAISATRLDGAVRPLELRLPRLTGAELDRRRFVAAGRLEPGLYSGLVLRFTRARLMSEHGASDLLVEPKPVTVQVAFSIVRRRATLLSLSADGLPVAGAYAFKPSFAGALPARTVPELAGVISSTSAHDVALFDKQRGVVTAILAGGDAPAGVAVDPLRRRAYVAQSGDDAIAVIDLAAAEEVARIKLGPGDSPRELAITPDGQLLLSANAGSNTVSFIDPAALLEQARVQTAEAPSSLLLDRSGRRAFVFHQRANAAVVLDLATRTVSATIATEDLPLRGQLDRTGARLYVASPASAYLTVFSTTDFAVERRVYVGLGVAALKVDAATDLLYLSFQAEPRIAVFDPMTLLPVESIPLAAPVSWMAIDDVQNALFAVQPARRSIAVVDLRRRGVRSELELPFDPGVLALSGERN